MERVEGRRREGEVEFIQGQKQKTKQQLAGEKSLQSRPQLLTPRHLTDSDQLHQAWPNYGPQAICGPLRFFNPARRT